jgi:hypothetical protein
MNNLSFKLKQPTWASDLVQEPDPEKKWVVEDMLERGDRLIVTGNEGEGKSTWLRQLAIQFASGIHPFTLKPMNPCKVLLVDLENSREQIKAETKKITERAGIEVPGEPWLAIADWPAGINLTHADFEAAFHDVLNEYRPDVVIGGPLYKTAEVSLSDENASRQVTAALDRLRAEFGFALIMEAHQVNESTAFDNQAGRFIKNRPPRPFGSSVWRRWPEFGLCLFTDGTLYKWRGDRQARAWPMRMQRDGDVWLWEVDSGTCPVCGDDRPEGKDRYCSTRCRETAKKRRQRAGTRSIQEELRELI